MSDVQYDFPVQPRRAQPEKGLVRRKYPLETMRVGGFIFFPGKATRGVSSYISSESRKIGRRFRVRRCFARQVGDGWVPAEPEEAGAVSGAGVWRTE
jgi:hypothetical protein